jgi:hypothetical protein
MILVGKRYTHRLDYGEAMTAKELMRALALVVDVQKRIVEYPRKGVFELFAQFYHLMKEHIEQRLSRDANSRTTYKTTDVWQGPHFLDKLVLGS